MPVAQQLQGLERNQTTCVSNYGNKDIRMYGYKGNVIPLSNTVIHQSVEEWLDDYNSVE